MKVAIIGTGNVGRALGASLTNAGHEVTMAATTPESARAAATQIGADAAASALDASEGADVVILAVPYAAVSEVAQEIGQAADGKIVVDVTNPLKPDLSGLAPETSAAEEVQRALPHALVVKAFNTVLASRQANPALDGEAVDGFVAGDDPEAKRTVLSLAESIGLRPLDAGPLSYARYLEGMALLNIAHNALHGGSWTSGWRLVR